MRTFWVWITLFISTFVAIPAFARGAISSGGGNGVFTGTGTFRFLDMILNNDLDTFVSPDRYLGDALVAPRCQHEPLKKIEPDLKFTSIFWQRIRHYDFRLGVALEFSIRRVAKRAFSVNFDLRPMEVFSDSERVDSKLQIPVGGYGGNYLLLNQRLYQMLSPRDQAAFLVHEGLREYAVSLGFEVAGISLSDLETATRLIIDAPDSPEIPRLLKSREILYAPRFSLVYGSDTPNTYEQSMDMLETLYGEPSLKPELAAMLLASLMELDELRLKVEDNPEDKKLIEELIESQRSILELAMTYYRPGVDVALRLKMLELEKALSMSDNPGSSLVFDTRDILWRKVNDPACLR